MLFVLYLRAPMDRMNEGEPGLDEKYSTLTLVTRLRTEEKIKGGDTLKMPYAPWSEAQEYYKG
jgi:hypothetical protein